MMNDFLSYLKNAFHKSSKPKEEPRNAVSADNSNQGKGHSFVHFQRGDQIIYEPGEVHQLKYINDKGEVNPIKGL